jgi:hypothetical protein
MCVTAVRRSEFLHSVRGPPRLTPYDVPLCFALDDDAHRHLARRFGLETGTNESTFTPTLRSFKFEKYSVNSDIASRVSDVYNYTNCCFIMVS